MLKLEHTEVVGWEAAIRGMRNPMNSWEKSDSGYCTSRCKDCEKTDCSFVYTENPGEFCLGKNDHDLMMRLRNAGTDHRKFMRMITVYVDITGPLYWWKEFDTYKVGTVANSCSTMHKIAAKEFTLEDFSCEHLLQSSPTQLELYSALASAPVRNGKPQWTPMMHLLSTIAALNHYRQKYHDAQDSDEAKKYWWQMIQLLPSSYNQKRTIMLNYEVLAGIYPSRKDHKLDEWHVFCDWIVDLPYSEIITGMTASEKIHEGFEEGIKTDIPRGKRSEVPGIIDDHQFGTVDTYMAKMREDGAFVDVWPDLLLRKKSRKLLVVGVPSTAYIRQEATCCLSEFQSKGLSIRRVSLDKTQALIDTDKCRIIFRSAGVVDRLRGLKCDVCFGFSKEDQCLLNWSHQPTDYKGTFLDYVYEVEGIKER